MRQAPEVAFQSGPSTARSKSSSNSSASTAASPSPGVAFAAMTRAAEPAALGRDAALFLAREAFGRTPASRRKSGGSAGRQPAANTKPTNAARHMPAHANPERGGG